MGGFGVEFLLMQDNLKPGVVVHAWTLVRGRGFRSSRLASSGQIISKPVPLETMSQQRVFCKAEFTDVKSQPFQKLRAFGTAGL